LARIGAFNEGSRSIKVRAMQNAMPSLPILVCSIEGLLMAISWSISWPTSAAGKSNRRG
jgi:hypothetical protein